jgi:ribonuclease BN (tRNA processing enzyme)
VQVAGTCSRRTLSPPAFPITPEGLRGRWRFLAWDGDACVVEGFTVRAVDVAHKGGRTFAHRVERDGASLAYLPDHAPAAGTSPALMDLLSGVDLLIHDAQYLDGDRPGAIDFGHATVEDAVALAVRSGAGALLLFHHSPSRTDEALDEIAAWAAGLAPALPVSVAREGDVINVAPAQARPFAFDSGQEVVEAEAQSRPRP